MDIWFKTKFKFLGLSLKNASLVNLFFCMIFVFNDFLSQGDLSVGSDKQLIDIMIYALSIRGNQKFGFPL